MSLRKSTKTRLINAKYITTDIDKFHIWGKARRVCALIGHSELDIIENKNNYAQQMTIFESLLGQIPEGNTSYKRRGIPNRTRVF